MGWKSRTTKLQIEECLVLLLFNITGHFSRWQKQTEQRKDELKQQHLQDWKDSLGQRKNKDIEAFFSAAYGSVSAGREKWPFNVLFF